MIGNMDVTLKVKKYKTEGDVAWEYHPLRNIKADDGSITNFQVDNDQLNIKWWYKSSTYN